MPASVRDAVTRGWPWPETVAAAWSEYEAAEALDSDRYAFEPGYTPHRWVEARRYVLEEVLDTFPARSLNDLRARLSWMEHLSSLESQWTHDDDATRLATLRADIERMGARLKHEDETVQSGHEEGSAQSAHPLPSPNPGTSKPVQYGQGEGAGSQHPPLRRTNADKRRDVLARLQADADQSGIAPLSDREIARRAGVSPQTVSNIRHGR